MAYSQSFIKNHREINVHHDWWDSVYDDFHRICEILGIELDKDEPSFSGFWSQGDGASFTGRYRACGLSFDTPSGYVATYDLAPAKIREYAPQDEELHHIADELCLLARIYHPTYAKVGRPYGSNYVHSNTMYVTEWEYYDEDIGFEGVDTAIAHHIEETLIAQFRALADWLYKTLEREYDYLTSDEAVVETLEANEIVEEEEEEV
jgi:hypothetical protein